MEKRQYGNSEPSRPKTKSVSCPRKELAREKTNHQSTSWWTWINISVITTKDDGNPCETEYLWSTKSLNPEHLCDWSILAEVDSIKVLNPGYVTVNLCDCGDFGVPIPAQIHMMVMSVKQNLCGGTMMDLTSQYLCDTHTLTEHRHIQNGAIWVHNRKFVWFFRVTKPESMPRYHGHMREQQVVCRPQI